MKSGVYKTSFLGTDYLVHYVTSPTTAKMYLERLQTQNNVIYALDTETESLPQYKQIGDAALSPHLSKIRLIQIFTGKSAIVFDCKHIAQDLLFTNFFETQKFVLHNGVFDIQYLYKYFKIKTIDAGCTYLAAKLLMHALRATDEGLSASLRNLVNTAFKEELLKEMQTSDWSVSELTWEQVEYASLDAISTYFLALRLGKKINRLGLRRIYELYKNAQAPIAKLQLSGIKLNVNAHRDLIASWRADAYKAKKELLTLTSLKDITSLTVSKYLEKTLSKNILSIWPRTDTGKLATDAHVFSDFDFVDIVKPFSEYQRLEKLCTSFGNSLISSVNPETKRLHSQYKLAGARTGRLSSSRPNLQQLPRDTQVRKNFCAEGDNIFLRADYSQIEIRVGAELSRDKVMLKAYRDGVDLHALTASLISKKPLSEVTKEDRQQAKAFNFGLMFGLGATKFSHYAKKSYGVEVSNSEAKDGVDTFRKNYYGYREWQIKQSNEAAKFGYVVTPCGKRRCLDEKNSYGASMNTPIQGGASECMLYSLIRLDKELTRIKANAMIVNCVHDEIIVEAVPKDKEEVSKIIKESMTAGFLDVFPEGITNGITEVTSGKNWAESKA